MVFNSILGGKFRTGQRVRFECSTGDFHTDTIRACFYQIVDVLRLRKGVLCTVGHRRVPAILLDNHSWVLCKDAKHE